MTVIPIWKWALLPALLISSVGCSHQRAGWRGEARSPRLLVVIDLGLSQGMTQERRRQHHTVGERMAAELERSFSRSGYETHVIESVEEASEQDFRPGTFVLAIRLRRYLPGDARDGVVGPDADDAAMLRTAYQLRDEEGRLVRSAATVATSRRSWQRAVDEVCRETHDEVTRAIREFEECRSSS